MLSNLDSMLFNFTENHIDSQTYCTVLFGLYIAEAI